MRARTRAFALLFTATALPVHAQWTTDIMPQARVKFAATATAEKLYIAGGKFQWTVLDSIDVLDIATGTWSQMHLSGPRHSLAATSVGHEVFFGGGIPLLDNSGGALDTVDIYNESTDTWSVEHLPVPIGYLGAGAIGAKVYFAGGLAIETQPFDSILRPILQVFDTVNRTWIVRRTPGPGRGFLNVVSDERWVCIGAGGGLVPSQRLIDIYDSWNDSWIQVIAPEDMLSIAMTTGRLQMTSCSNGLPEHVLYEYDLESGTWSMRRRPTDRCASSSASIGPFTILANGLFPGNVVYPDAEVYNRLTDRWQTRLLSIAARERVTVVHEWSSSVFVIGGQTTGSELSLIDHIDIFHAFPKIGDSYCSPSSMNSIGRPAHIDAAGLVTIADNWFFLGLSDAPPDHVALFLIGSQATTATIPPGSQGNLCLGGTVDRVSATVGIIRADGTYGSQLDLGLPTLPMAIIGAGETWHFQAWFRDTNPGPTTNLTDALSVTFE